MATTDAVPTLEPISGCAVNLSDEPSENYTQFYSTLELSNIPNEIQCASLLLIGSQKPTFIHLKRTARIVLRTPGYYYLKQTPSMS